MPRHIRQNFLHSIQSVLDASWEFQQLERLTAEEKEEVASVREELLKTQERIASLVSLLEERGDFQIPSRKKVSGPSFAWAEHDARAKRKKIEDRLAQLKAKLANLYVEEGCHGNT